MRDISIFQIPVSKIEPHPQNPRKDLGDLTELCDSIQRNGIMQNLTVVPLDDDMNRFRCVIGHRRLAAAKKVGLFAVPVTIAQDMDEREQLATMIAENMQRADLTIPEQAQAVQMMLDLGEDFESIADRTGLSESTVRRRAKLAAYDQTALSKAFKRGASLFDLEKIEKIEDPELQAKCLAAAGTKSFDLEIDRAKRAINEKKQQERIVEVVKKLPAEETDSVNGKHYAGWISEYVLEKELSDDSKIEDFKKRTFPSDAKIFYRKGSGGAALYYTSEEKDRKKEEQDQLKEIAAEKEKRVHGVCRSIYDRIGRFIADRIRAGKTMSPEVQKEAAEIFKCDFLSGYAISRTCDAFCRKEGMTDGWTNDPKNVALFAVFVRLLYDEDKLRPEDGQISEEIDRLYKVIESLGYEASEEETDFFSGQHECFKPIKEDDK